MSQIADTPAAMTRVGHDAEVWASPQGQVFEDALDQGGYFDQRGDVPRPVPHRGHASGSTAQTSWSGCRQVLDCTRGGWWSVPSSNVCCCLSSTSAPGFTKAEWAPPAGASPPRSSGPRRVAPSEPLPFSARTVERTENVVVGKGRLRRAGRNGNNKAFLLQPVQGIDTAAWDMGKGRLEHLYTSIWLGSRCW